MLFLDKYQSGHILCLVLFIVVLSFLNLNLGIEFMCLLFKFINLIFIQDKTAY